MNEKELQEKIAEKFKDKWEIPFGELMSLSVKALRDTLEESKYNEEIIRIRIHAYKYYLLKHAGYTK